MKTIGVTGGVGSGKSSVLDMLESMCSCIVVRADDEAKKLMRRGQPAYNEVVGFFGDEVIGSDGELDRPVLAKIIFNNPNKRIVLNSIVHPLVKQTIVNIINDHKIAGDKDYCFVEAALLLEDHYDVFMDEIWYVYADEAVRRERLKDSRGYSDAKIDSMIKSQLGEADFRARADRVIDNSGSPEKTRAQLVNMLGM